MIKTLTKHAVGRRTIPILGQVRVKGGVMQTTDMDFWISGPCPLADGMYHSHGFDKGIQIKSELPVTDFPEPNKNNKKYDKAALVIDRAAADTLAWVLKAASKEAARYYLNGVFFFRCTCPLPSILTGCLSSSGHPSNPTAFENPFFSSLCFALSW